MAVRDDSVKRVASTLLTVASALAVTACSTPGDETRSKTTIERAAYALDAADDFAVNEQAFVPAQDAWDVASSATVSLIVWQDVGLTNRVYSLRIGPDGNALDSAPVLLAAGGGPPQVATDGSHFLVAWGCEDGACVQRVSASGAMSTVGRIQSPAGVADVASNGSGYLVVSGGSGTAHAARVDAAGVVLDAAAVELGWSHGNLSVTAVGNAYLATWTYFSATRSTEIAPGHVAYAPDVYGAWIDAATGNVRAPGRFLVGTAPPGADFFWQLRSPHSAVSQQLALVTWQAAGALYGRRVASDGTWLDPEVGFVIRQPVPSLQDGGSLASNGTGFLLTWLEANFGSGPGSRPQANRAVRLSAQGSSMDVAPLLIDGAPLAADGERYLVAKSARHVQWVDSSGQVTTHTADVRVRREEASPSLVRAGSGYRMLFAAAGATQQLATLNDSSHTTSEIALGSSTWTALSASNTGAIVGRTFTGSDRVGVVFQAHYQTIDASGATSGARIVGDPRAAFLGALASDGERFAILSTQAFSRVSGVSRVAPDGTLLDASPTAVSAAAGSQLVFTGHDYLALATDVTCTDACRVYGARVSQEGELLTPTPTPVLTRATKPAGLDAATDGTLVLMVWHEGTQIWGSRVASDGSSLDPQGFPIATDATAKELVRTAYSGARYAVVWRDATTRDLYGARVTLAGTVVDASPVRLTTYGDVGGFDVAPASDGQWLVVYDRFDSQAEGRHVRGKFVNFDGPGSIGCALRREPAPPPLLLLLFACAAVAARIRAAHARSNEHRVPIS
jgi:hypothetical protein